VKKYILTTIIVCAFQSWTLAQNNIFPHNTMWVRVLFNDKITDKLRWEVMMQHRRQSVMAESINIVEKSQLNAYWTWLHYQFSKEIKVSLMPFCQFATSPLFTEGQTNGRTIHEFRWAVRLEHQKKFKHFQLMNRGVIEYRWRDFLVEDKYIPNWRVRYMLRFTKPIKAKWLKDKSLNLLFYNEILVQFGEAVSSFPSIFDQNRIYVGVSYGVLKNVRVDLAYSYVFQQKRNKGNFDIQNALNITLTFDNIFSQFKNKKDK